MRNLIAVLFLLLVAQLSAFPAGDTNEFTLFKHQGRRAAYEWRISEARILATPEWKIDSKKIPLSPGKAWRIVQDWHRRQGAAGAGDLVRMEICQFYPSKLGKNVRGRYYYRIEFIPRQFDSMLAVVLMDGTVLEPRGIPHLAPEEIK
jgi:hypothetical protein